MSVTDELQCVSLCLDVGFCQKPSLHQNLCICIVFQTNVHLLKPFLITGSRIFLLSFEQIKEMPVGLNLF